jgi:hypothetical protein
VQALELILLGSGVIVALAYVATPFLGRSDVSRPAVRLLLGIVPGVIGVFIVLTDRLDILPDDLEGPVWAVTIITISAAAIVGTSYRLVRR